MTTLQASINKNAYPFCLPAPLSLPKKNYNKIFEHQRKEFRTNELLRREKMKEMIKEIEKNEKVSEKGESSGIRDAMKNLLKTEKCSNCDKDIILGTFVYTCECCGAMLCGECIKKRKYQKKNEDIVDVTLCKYCDFIYIAITEDEKYKRHIKQGNEDAVYLLRCQIINSCISYMEEYATLNLFIKELISNLKPKKEDVKKCQDEMKIVKVKTQKVLSLDGFVDSFDQPERKSDQIVFNNIVRTMNIFKRDVVFDSINEVVICEKILQEVNGLRETIPQIIGFSSTMIPITGGTIKITLTSTNNVKVIINEKVIPCTIDGLTMIVNVPPSVPGQVSVNIQLLYNKTTIDLPGPIMYYKVSKDQQEKSSISTIGTKHKISIVECDESISDDPSEEETYSDSTSNKDSESSDEEENVILFSKNKKEEKLKQDIINTLQTENEEKEKPTIPTRKSKRGNPFRRGGIIKTINYNEIEQCQTQNVKTIKTNNFLMDSSIKITMIRPKNIKIKERVMFTIKGSGFGTSPMVFIGNKEVKKFEKRNDNLIIGYFPIIEESDVYDLKVKNNFGGEEIKPKEIRVED
ncbi:hypothetical protein EDI_340240 [Entamoeba dispar SAW760]|uniref:IPT/TIG domain-containing protein n=1 Tax=Entamoeba dispar (strain ATCC PRA-260 / SAW760) TaxID=370354 RepID=B0ES49_ENTDS|nr:uncharacterized protein EDI_340240 [Entamoeba dispar SAW760]EDR22658.1 hypothetical protein EDI_340240 [Entamoeba dispar SAW760]|eukprot:EDR22658.1 hypothetical protein EDI_340240 [Entamoeba dispar SAW760]